jgi:RHH-type transcriptional regulator, rel operon repressor / antitoxin RelB
MILSSIRRMHMLYLRLPEAMEKRLERLARRTGLAKSAHVREAILKHIDDLEQVYRAEKRAGTNSLCRRKRL